MEAYEYSRLPAGEDAIRILTLLPGRKTDKIKCELSTRTLETISDNGTYDAVSYCWGALDATMKIYVQDKGRSNPGIVAVKPNLYAALQVFRHEKDARKLWIDAICIDQTNNEEKNVQVTLMRRIYEGSSGVLIWLGNGTRDSDAATSLIRKLSNAATIDGPTLPTMNVLSSQDLAKYGLPPLLSRDYVSLLSLLETEWFNRAWVVQEVAVAKKATLFWGPYSADWNDLLSGLEFALKAHLALTAHPAVNSLMPIADEAANYRAKRCTLLGVLLRHRRCQATNPVDKAYAFLGLTENSAEPQAKIPVDYKQDLRTVYTDVARMIATHDKSLDILSLPALPLVSGIEGLPSWVPDWSIPTGGDAEQVRRTLSGETKSLANKEEAEHRISNPFCAAKTTLYTCGLLSPHQQTLLATRGHVVDTVAAVGDISEGIYMPSNLRSMPRFVRSILKVQRTLSTWEDVAELHTRDMNDKYAGGEDIVDAYRQTLATGNLSEEEKEERKRNPRDEFLQIYGIREPNRTHRKRSLGFLQILLVAFQLPVMSMIQKEPRAKSQPQSRYILFRRMIRTEQKRYIGLVSGNVRQGDEVWLLEGSKVPLIIRRQTEGYGRLIGDAYIHGIMYGEAFRIGDCEDLILE